MTSLPPKDLLLQNLPDRRRVVILPEGTDPRVVRGGVAAQNAGLADIIFVGAGDAVREVLAAQGGTEQPGVQVHDPTSSPLTAELAKAYYELRAHRGVDTAKAAELIQDPLVYAAMMVRQGKADGTVGGAVNATSDVVRAAIQCIGVAPDTALVSSFFLMLAPNADGRAMVYADCGLVIDPSATELAEIAKASATSCRALLRSEPYVAMLSFSTKGSARHMRVTKVTDALEHLRQIAPDLPADGELQFDAALLPSIGSRKAPDSTVAGKANVMIFPDLDAGNIAYKITQRLGGYEAYGPIMQGLAKPANDLSRGCSAEDVTQMIAVTVLQGLD